MGDNLRLFLLVIAPLFVVGVTILAWCFLIVVQTPAVFRRNRFNMSLLGTLIPLGIYLVGRALNRAGLPVPVDMQVVVTASATFALIGWPSIIRHLREFFHTKE